MRCARTARLSVPDSPRTLVMIWLFRLSSQQRRSDMERRASEDHLHPTPILNSTHPEIVRFTQELLAHYPAGGRSFLQAAHQRLSEQLSAVYTLNERQPAAITLMRG